MLLKDFQIIKNISGPNRRKTAQLFLVRYMDDEQFYVLKIIEKQKVKEEILSLIRFEKQIEIPEILSKPVVWEEDDKNIYIVRPYLSGENLDDFIKQIPLRKRKHIANEILLQMHEILKKLHSYNYVHCDIKPSNIIVDTIENKLNIKLIDFAFAHELSRNSRPKIFAMVYSPPELILNSVAYISSSTDYYSLGIVIYKILTGLSPWNYRHPAVMTSYQLTEQIPGNKGISKNELEILQQICRKPKFEISPQQMNKLDLNILMQQRKISLNEMEELVKNLSSLLIQKRKVGFLKNIFSKSDV